MKKQKIKIIGLTIIYMFFMLGIAFYATMINKRSIKDRSNIAFISAIEKEKKSLISKVYIKYDPKYSPDSISAGEKIDWATQTILTMEDSCRHRLDSIFCEEIKKQGLNLTSSISCTYNGKATNNIETKVAKGIKIIHEVIYRKDYKKENDITLRAYVYIPLHVLIGSTTLYILIVLSITGPTVFIFIKNYRREQTEETATPVEAKARTTDNIKWIIINKDILWDEKNCIIKKGEKTIMLKGESLKFFRMFLKSESFFLRHNDIYNSYGLKNELPEFKDRIYHSIKELRKDLTDLDINIKAVRGMGYQLTFH
ncbi:MAG: hypothetical protein ACLTOV_06335 [Phocaeicola sp.]